MAERFGVDVRVWAGMTSYERMQARKEWMKQRAKRAYEREKRQRKRRRDVAAPPKEGDKDFVGPPTPAPTDTQPSESTDKFVGPPKPKYTPKKEDFPMPGDPDFGKPPTPTHTKKWTTSTQAVESTKKISFTQQEFMQQQYDVMKDLERQDVEAQGLMGKLPGIDPLGMYRIQTDRGEKIITGLELKQQIRDYAGDVRSAYLLQQTNWQQSLALDPRTEVISTKEGFLPIPPDTRLDWTKQELSKINQLRKEGERNLQKSDILANLTGAGQQVMADVAKFGFGFVSSAAAFGRPVADFTAWATGTKTRPVHYVAPWDVVFEPIGWSPKGSIDILKKEPLFTAGGLLSEAFQSLIVGKALSKTWEVTSPYIKGGLQKTGGFTQRSFTKISEIFPTQRLGGFGKKVLQTEPFEYFGKWTHGWKRGTQLVSGVTEEGITKTTTRITTGQTPGFTVETIDKTIMFSGKQKVWLSPAEQLIASKNLKRWMDEGFEFVGSRLTKKSRVTNIFDDVYRDKGIIRSFSEDFAGKGSHYKHYIGMDVPKPKIEGPMGRWVTYPLDTQTRTVGHAAFPFSIKSDTGGIIGGIFYPFRKKYMVFDWGWKDLMTTSMGKYQTALPKKWIEKLYITTHPSLWVSETGTQMIAPKLSTTTTQISHFTSKLFKGTGRAGLSVYSPNVVFRFGTPYMPTITTGGGLSGKTILQTLSQKPQRPTKRQPVTGSFINVEMRDFGIMFKPPSVKPIQQPEYDFAMTTKQTTGLGFKPGTTFLTAFDQKQIVAPIPKLREFEAVVFDLTFDFEHPKPKKVTPVSPVIIPQFSGYGFPFIPFGLRKRLPGSGAGSFPGLGGELGYKFREFKIPSLEKIVKKVGL